MNTTQHIEAEIDAYFATASQEQLAADMTAAEFDSYNQIGRKLFTKRAFTTIPVYAPPYDLISHATPIAAPAGKTDELPLAA